MSKIEWTGETWNPTVGCSKVSTGCSNCYAIKDAHRLAGNPNPKIGPIFSGLTERRGDRTEWTGKVNFVSERLQIPLQTRKPTMWFVNSMSDLFHESVSFEVIAAIFGVIEVTPHHTYQVLTKRPQRMLEFFEWLRSASVDPWTECHFWALQNDDQAEVLHRLDYKGNYPWPLSNLWLGVTAENQRTADERIPLLLQTPAAVRFLSCEPLLQKIDLTAVGHGTQDYCNALTGYRWDYGGTRPCPQPFAKPIDWVIVGGESGAKTRTCDINWIRSIVEQCRVAGMPCFVKQLGSNTRNLPVHCGNFGRSKGKMNYPSEWPEDLRVRQMPEVHAVSGVAS